MEYLVDKNSLILRGIGGSLGLLAASHGRLYLGGNDSHLEGTGANKVGGPRACIGRDALTMAIFQMLHKRPTTLPKPLNDNRNLLPGLMA